jgi:large subunit ribosomal protein L31
LRGDSGAGISRPRQTPGIDPEQGLVECSMKIGIHPKYYPVVFVDGEFEIVTRSTVTSAEKRVIDGVEHNVIHVDVSAYTHPFFTGKQKLMDTEGRIDRFNKKYKKNVVEAPKP